MRHLQPPASCTRIAWANRSSRRIERLCERDVAYRVITANSFPDHTTISRFRQGHENELAGLFVKKRSQAVEPIFGQIKDARGIGRFMRRGLSAADSESKIICATHNLLKLFRSTLRSRATAEDGSAKTTWN